MRVCLLGGGISGLSQAYFIKQMLPSAQVTLYEAQSRLGGSMESLSSEGQNTYHFGPRSLRNSPEITSIA